MNSEVDLLSYAFACVAIVLGGVSSIALLRALRSLKDRPSAPDQAFAAAPQVSLRQYYTAPSRDRRNSNERYVSKALRTLDNDHYVVLDDIQLKSRNPRIDSAQIDHIVVSNFGIFVIETKGYRGMIFGNDKDQRWTQCRFDGEHKTFINPERQNYGHVLALTHLLRRKAVRPIESVCVFPYADVLNLKGTDKTYDLRGALRHLSDFRDQVYTNQQVNGIVAMILDANQTSDYERERHVAQAAALAPQ